MTPAIAVLQKVLAAYGSQRDPVNDSDLDNEQPIALSVYLTLGELRRIPSIPTRFSNASSSSALIACMK